MTTATPTPTEEPAVHSAVHTYERLLVLYPKPFRDEYGHDMTQLFGDLVMQMGGGNAGRVWPRVLRDLVSSATRQRVAALATPGGRRPTLRGVLIVVAVVAVSLLVGNPLLIPLAVIMLDPVAGVSVFVLPVAGVLLLRHCWVAWRTAGDRRWIRALLGLACFAPGIWWMIANDGGGWLTFIFIVVTLIYGLGLGAIWGIVVLVRSRRQSATRQRRLTAAVMIVAAVVVLGSMAGAGFNSYLNARKPPGDHSVANATSDSRTLWQASKSGDVETVAAKIDACADPFVAYPDGYGSRARSNAEWFAGAGGNPRPAPEPARSRYLEIIDQLKIAEKTWSERCNP